MKVLAIDPGFGRMGTAVLEGGGSRASLLYSGCFTTSGDTAFPLRLRAIGKEIERLVHEFQPTAIALEQLFFNTNQKTALQVAEARGAILYAATTAEAIIYEYTPLQVKIAVTGYGRSEKREVVTMLHRLISIEKTISYDDEYDAIAIGLTCLASVRHMHS